MLIEGSYGLTQVPEEGLLVDRELLCVVFRDNPGIDGVSREIIKTPIPERIQDHEVLEVGDVPIGPGLCCTRHRERVGLLTTLLECLEHGLTGGLVIEHEQE